MEIILKQYVQGLGEKGDIVAVKDGYARNFLIPKGMALLATESAKKIQAENERQAQHKKEHILLEAQKLAETLSAKALKIETLVGESGKIFGAITNTMISNKLSEQGVDVDRKRIAFESEIKTVGTYNVIIDLHKEVKATIPIEVVASES